MPEAVKAVIDWMFEHTDIDFLTCGYFVHNRQSKRVQEKCGFQFLKYIEFETILGTTEKTSLNILYRSDWQKTKGTEWISPFLCAVYFLSPIDVLPDILPVLGFADDGAFILFVLLLIHKDLENFRGASHSQDTIIEAEVVDEDNKKTH